MVTGTLVRLRAPEPRDAESFYRWFNDPAAIAGLGLRYPVPRKVERDWVTAQATPSYAATRFAVETLDGTLLGSCGLFDGSAENRSAELGVAVVDRAQQGKGYGTDTVRTLCRFGFEQMGLHRIELLVFAQHETARAVYEKVGFVTEGVARQAHWGDGRWYDDVHMSLLEGELR